jgi:sulfur relay (sulfurtransferase) complex TusBCD TusD component (DsrE family)
MGEQLTALRWLGQAREPTDEDNMLKATTCLTAAAIRGSSDEPATFVDIELHRDFVSHFQQEGLASLLVALGPLG